jgi:hypothetical protein
MATFSALGVAGDASLVAMGFIPSCNNSDGLSPTMGSEISMASIGASMAASGTGVVMIAGTGPAGDGIGVGSGAAVAAAAGAVVTGSASRSWLLRFEIITAAAIGFGGQERDKKGTTPVL